MDYNPIAQRFDAYSDHATTDWELGLKPVAVLLEPLHAKKVLDYGCGSGNFANYLAQGGAEVTGVDVSSEMVKMAQDQGISGVTYQVIESGDLSVFKDETFDVVTTNFVLCTMASQEEIARVLKELHRVLKGGGIVTTLNANWEAGNGREFISAKLNYVEELKAGMAVETTLKGEKVLLVRDYFWPKAAYIHFFEEAGFKDITVTEMKALDDSQAWVDEREYSPLFILSASKK